MPEHVDRSLSLFQDDISQERLVFAFVLRSHVHEDHFVRDGTCANASIIATGTSALLEPAVPCLIDQSK